MAFKRRRVIILCALLWIPVFAGMAATASALAVAPGKFDMLFGGKRWWMGIPGQGAIMAKKKSGGYDPAVELAKGAKFLASSYDETQTVKITAAKVTVGGTPGAAVFSGVATGKYDTSIDGTINLWLSIFRYMRPDGTIDHVGGWNIPLALKKGQTAAATAKAFAKIINSGTRPYRAAAAGATLKVFFKNK